MKSTHALPGLLVLCLAGAAHGSAGVFTGDGHSIELSSTEDVQMVSEEVDIIPGRGRFLFNGGVGGMDRVEYRCRFVLKNLKDKEVSVNVGFPLNSQFLNPPYDNKHETSELVAQYSFIAQEKDFQYSVRYAPGDKEKKLKNLFLWTMSFAPGETRTLLVSYAMPISMGLASTAVDREAARYEKRWYGALQACLVESFGYVTRTGRSWSGTIEKATFRIHVGGFEAYLQQRPFMEEADEEARAKTRERFPVRVPMAVRTASPGGWTWNEEGVLERSFENYEPTEDLLVRYYIIPFPREPEEARKLMAILAPEGMADEDRKDLADIFREFNGTKTGNKRIAKFLANQVWHGKPIAQKIPNEVLEAIEKG